MYMKNYLTIFIVILVIFSCKRQDVTNKIADSNKVHLSIHYKVNERYYYSGGIDTTYTPYEVWAIKDSEDTLKNGYIWVDNNYRPYNMIYQKGDLYLAIPPKKTTVLYSNFKEDIISQVDWIDIFLKPGILQKQIDDKQNAIYISDTIFSEKKAVILKIEFPENQKGQKVIYSYILDKKNMVPVWALMKIVSPDNIYYDELSFRDFEYDKVNKNDLLKRQKKVLSANPVKHTGSNSETKRMEAMLHIGDNAPDFTGKYYSSGNDFHLNDFIGRDIVIIDFWYTHCPPCVKAMPYLSDLSKRYKNKGLKILGLNSVDNQGHSMDNLKKFLNNRNIDYDVVLIEPEVDIRYKVNGYPTMYIIDKSGKIAYVELGFDEKKYEELEKKIGEMVEVKK